MKKLLKIIAVGAAALLGLVLLAALYINLAPMPVHDVKQLPLQVSHDTASVLQGKKIVETVCWTCHKGTDDRLSGAKFSTPESAFGEIWSSNITQHDRSGIGSYSDGELAYLLRTGINREGRFIGPFMLFPNMADQDIAAIIAFLHSDSPIVRPVEAKRPQPAYSFLAKALLKLGAMKPLPASEKPIERPSPSDVLSYGRYLSTSAYACYQCHSKSFETNNPLDPELSEGYFAGGNTVEDRDFQPVISSNLTPSNIKWHWSVGLS